MVYGKNMKLVTGGVCAPSGFRASGIACGIKKGEKRDLALIYSKVPCAAAGLFTSNRVKAAPCKVTKENLKAGAAQAVIINSGNANCATGRKGFADAAEMARAVAAELKIGKDNALVASTGIIGKKLPIQKIKDALPALVGRLSRDGNRFACEAILTTDTRPKEFAVELGCAGAEVRIGAMAKGAGMVSPKLEGTMLAFVTTDANIESGALLGALKLAADASFNAITIDGDMSTNDTLLILANGLAENRKLKMGSPGFKKFSSALTYVCRQLSDMIVADGEGATKFVRIFIKGAKDDADAHKVADKVANSALVKTALYGCDPNFGRVLAAVGASGACVAEKKIDIFFGNTCVVRNGAATISAREKLAPIFKKRDITINIDLNLGAGSAFVSTCDLSSEYVRINAEYS